MQPKYAVRDGKGVSGQSISLNQGDTVKTYLFFLDDNGAPLFLTGTVSTIVAKIYKDVSAASIQKTLAATTLAKIEDSTLGLFGVSFSLSAVDTAAIVANNSGIPVRVAVTMADSTVYDLNFLSIYTVAVPTVTT